MTTQHTYIRTFVDHIKGFEGTPTNGLVIIAEDGDRVELSAWAYTELMQYLHQPTTNDTTK